MSIQSVDHSERLNMPPAVLSYYWQRRKWKRYVIVAGVLFMTIWIWFDQRATPYWISRIVMSIVSLWVLHLLIDYRTTIDKKNGTFTREKLLLGRYQVGAVRLPLEEFVGVVLDHYEDQEDSTTTVYVCLRHRNGQLKEVCFFELLSGQRNDGADRAAQELAEMTGLHYENAVQQSRCTEPGDDVAVPNRTPPAPGL
jgi:hypothetical protein